MQNLGSNRNSFRLTGGEQSGNSGTSIFAFPSKNISLTADINAPLGLKADLKLATKRAIDFAGALALLIISSPLLVLVAIVIKLTSKGPIIFSQRRPGKELQPFSMLKFRTMAAGDDHEKEESLRMRNGNFCKTVDDNRITPIGRFLRKCSIDELPQLFNVLSGEMSLVGPRPILNCELETFAAVVQKRRFSMKPGLTGIWQISGRSRTGNEKRLEYDLQYIKNWSLLLDLKLLLKTIPTVIKCQGAM